MGKQQASGLWPQITALAEAVHFGILGQILSLTHQRLKLWWQVMVLS
jgi:hypothetical protein